MDILLSSTAAVAIAEIGDKTQLLSLFLSSRFKQRSAIIAGILVATLINHGISAWFGVWLLKMIPPEFAPWIVGASLLAIALWLLIPDRQGNNGPGSFHQYGAFVATTILFFLVEIGDKTQIATVVLAAKFNETFWVITGTTLGMMIANVPVVLAGRWLMDRLPLKYARWAAFALFIAMAVITLLTTVTG